MNYKLKLLAFFVLVACFCHAQAPAEPVTGIYKNPVFAGDYPDPSVLRDGTDYYMVHSSFQYYPGLLIWTSKDLVNWKPVTHALYKNVGSVWAPDIVKYNNRFYIYFPGGDTNYVVWADKISGPWSDPVDLKIGNGQIDPGHFTDDKGNRYLYFSSGSYVPLSKDGLATSGNLQHAYNGWPVPNDWEIECFCLEGPKILKHGKYYYLTTAQGGTAGPATSHMVVSARSLSPFGPWENSPYNPIERTLSQSEQWWSKGHATLIDDVSGKWWMVFHAYEKDNYNMGRQTLLLPVEWTADGWFTLPPHTFANATLQKPAVVQRNANLLSDAFTGDALGKQWQFFGDYDATRFVATKNGLVLKAKGNGIANSAPLLCIPAHHSYTVEVEVDIDGDASAGLILFYNQSLYTGIAANKNNIDAILRCWQFPTVKGVNKTHVYLKLQKTDGLVNMYYSINGHDWKKIENSAQVDAFHHNVLGGFLSLRLGLAASGNGSITFRNFVYTPQ